MPPPGREGWTGGLGGGTGIVWGGLVTGAGRTWGRCTGGLWPGEGGLPGLRCAWTEDMLNSKAPKIMTRCPLILPGKGRGIFILLVVWY